MKSTRYIKGLLGCNVTDKVTGFEGVVTSIAYDLYGCIQAVVVPEAKDGKVSDGSWFDVNRLRLCSTGVMECPDFDASYPAGKGPAHKPAR